MVEALIASALVLVPLFLAIPVIAKYMDIRSYTVQAARYAAWERTVWFGGAAAAATGSNRWNANEKTDDVIRYEIGHRVLSESVASPGSTAAHFSSSGDSGNGSAQGRQFWHDRQGNTLLKTYADNSAQINNGAAPGLVNTLLSPLLGITSYISSFTLDSHALYTANVGVTVNDVAYNTGAGLGDGSGGSLYIVSGAPVSFSEKSVLLANGWSANGPGSYAEYNTAAGSQKISVYNQIRGLTPASLLKPSSGVFHDFMSVLNSIALVVFPELSTLDLGRIQVDNVPADRLK